MVKARSEADKRHIKARDALYFLDNHPAMGMVARNLLWFDIMEVNHRGHAEPWKGKWKAHYTPANYKRFKKEFDKEFEELAEDSKNESPEMQEIHKKFASVEVPYKDLFGEDWVYSHVEYWGELTFTVWNGKKSDYDPKNWENRQGVDAVGHSYEEMVINVVAAFKKRFGNFDGESFLTKVEKENHKKEYPFLTRNIKDKPGYKRMLHNRKYMHVGPGELNRRWEKWFMKTPYGKKNWGTIS